MAEARRLIGLLLIVFTLLPLYRLLDPAVTGTAGDHTLTHVDTAMALMWTGLLLALIPFVVVLLLGAGHPIETRLRALAARLERVRATRFALAVALLATIASAAFSLVVLEGKPNLIDAMAQLVHARYLASGMTAGPTELADFFVFPNTVLTPRGWVSQYPPGYVAMLALGMKLGVVWLVGPVLLGITLFFTALVGERLLPERRFVVRAALLLAALSPFLIAHAGAYMNHTAAAAFTALAIWCLLNARDGRAAWALAAGVAASIALATRPLSAFVMVAAVGVVAWGPIAWSDRRPARFARLVGLALLGTLPVTIGQLAHNAHFFGAPATFGYFAAYGPAHELGLGQDPWGNRYGWREAVGYTSSDLSLLSVALFETPLPLVAVIGLFLLLARRLSHGERVIAAWALAPVAANFFYWHHGVFMGPRMLNEAAPAWALLAAVAVDALLRRVPVEVRVAARAYAPRAALLVALVAIAVGSVAFMAPRRLLSYGGDYLRSLRVPPPEAPAPAVVFVHGPWMSRVGSRLVASGMRLDSLETALRQNSTCAVHRYADARANDATPPRIDLAPRADSLPPSMQISPANYIRFVPGEPLDAACVANIRADEHGVLELAPFLWQGAPPGATTSQGGVVYVRDLGPERNRAMLEATRGRTPWVFASATPAEPLRLMPYDEGMRMLWGPRTPAPVTTVR